MKREFRFTTKETVLWLVAYTISAILAFSGFFVWLIGTVIVATLYSIFIVLYEKKQLSL